ncbi:DUF3817 domain-containing protein [Streptomyces sp. N2-109]|uniref:DUF3817 domain-containing protein n=1 Tax=Streptomyces gossypii TaxID=2883101 RepID=A0ABT2JY94_9ACTN|nr:DUF3817 domain-containing protein [Streptomyces gossypii]MCT2592868.1 DUF3817 domain-containing protein [Streptomyces gossypii]
MHPRPSQLALLRIAAHVEVISLLMLLGNLLTVHAEGVSSLTGPVHGCAYLFVVIIAVREAGAVRHPAVLRSLVPGVGGLLSVRLLGRQNPVSLPV